MLNTPPDPADEAGGSVGATDVREALLAAFLAAFKEIGLPTLVDWGRINTGDFFAALAKLVSSSAAAATPYGYVSDVPVERELTVEKWKRNVDDWLRETGEPPVNYDDDAPLSPQPTEEERVQQTTEQPKQPKRSAPAW